MHKEQVKNLYRNERRETLKLLRSLDQQAWRSIVYKLFDGSTAQNDARIYAQINSELRKALEHMRDLM